MDYIRVTKQLCVAEKGLWGVKLWPQVLHQLWHLKSTLIYRLWWNCYKQFGAGDWLSRVLMICEWCCGELEQHPVPLKKPSSSPLLYSLHHANRLSDTLHSFYLVIIISLFSAASENQGKAKWIDFQYKRDLAEAMNQFTTSPVEFYQVAFRALLHGRSISDVWM